MLEITRFWLEDMGADGFRLDAIRLLVEDGRTQENTPETHAWLRDFFTHYKTINPEALTVGEVWSGSEIVSRYVGDQMDLGFEFSLSYAITDAVKNQSAGRVLEQMKTLDELYPLGMYATFLRNHDQTRTIHDLGGDPKAAGLAATIQFCLPGVPFIYYGEEIGMSAIKQHGDEAIRTPMQWNNAPNAGFSQSKPWTNFLPGRSKANVKTQHAKRNSLLNLYRRLTRLRGAHPALRIGVYTAVATSRDDVLAFRRTLAATDQHPAEDLLCAFNLSDRPVTAYALSLGKAAGLELAPQHELLHHARTFTPTRPIRKLKARAGYVVTLQPTSANGEDGHRSNGDGD